MGTLFINPPTVLHLRDHYADRFHALGLPVVWNETGGFLEEQAILAQAPEATAMLAGADPYPAAFFQRATALRVFSKYGVGYDNVDLEAAELAGIPVTVTSGSNAQSVADYALSAMMALRLQLPAQSRDMQQGKWRRGSHADIGTSVLGIIGVGRIGSRVARMAKALGMTVLATDPLYSDPSHIPGVDVMTTLETILEQADIITLHCPKSETAPVFDRDMIAAMRPGSVLINMARGGLAHEEAVAEALRSGQLSGAALDVFEDEPPEHVDLWHGCTNLILTPHTAGSSDGAIVTGFEMALEVLEYHLGYRTELPRSVYLTQQRR